MANGDQPVAKASAFWGPILLSARIHATTAETWSAIRQYAEQSGAILPPGMFAEVNRMRTLATSLRNSGELLARAGDDAPLTSRMIGQQLYARNATERSLAPAYHVRFEVTTQTQAGPITNWHTLEYSGQLPLTVGDLRYEVGTYAESLMDSYGETMLDIGAVEIGEF